MRKKSAGLVEPGAWRRDSGRPSVCPRPSPRAPAHTRSEESRASSSPTGRPGATSSPNPAEEKKHALREQAITGLLDGKRTKVRSAAPAPWSRSAVRDRRSRSTARGRTDRPRDPRTSTSSSSREKTDKIFVILAEFGNERDPSYPDQDTEPGHAGPDHASTGRCTTRSPQPDRTMDNSTVWQPDYDRAALPDLYFGQGDAAAPAATESVKQYYERQSSGRYSVDGEVTDWVKVPYNEARYGRSNGYPCAGNVCSQHLGPGPRRHHPWVADQKAAGRTDADDQGRAGHVRPVGPQRLRPRRQLQRAGRLHRPLPDRARRRRPGRRRPDPGRGRHLVAPLEGLPGHRPGGPAGNPDGGTQIGDTGIWVGGLHDPARERRHERLRPRVRPRPRPARTTTTPRRPRRERRRASGR